VYVHHEPILFLPVTPPLPAPYGPPGYRLYPPVGQRVPAEFLTGLRYDRTVFPPHTTVVPAAILIPVETVGQPEPSWRAQWFDWPMGGATGGAGMTDELIAEAATAAAEHVFGSTPYVRLGVETHVHLATSWRMSLLAPGVIELRPHTTVSGCIRITCSVGPDSTRGNRAGVVVGAAFALVEPVASQLGRVSAGGPLWTMEDSLGYSKAATTVALIYAGTKLPRAYLGGVDALADPIFNQLERYYQDGGPIWSPLEDVPNYATAGLKIMGTAIGTTMGATVGAPALGGVVGNAALGTLGDATGEAAFALGQASTTWPVRDQPINARIPALQAAAPPTWSTTSIAGGTFSNPGTTTTWAGETRHTYGDPLGFSHQSQQTWVSSREQTDHSTTYLRSAQTTTYHDPFQTSFTTHTTTQYNYSSWSPSATTYRPSSQPLITTP
jgi:hypothetical protein